MKLRTKVGAFLATLIVAATGLLAVSTAAYASVYGPFLIKNHVTGLCLQSHTTSSTVDAWVFCDTGDVNSQWSFYDTGSAFQYWVLDAFGQCLTPYGMNNGDGVIRADCNYNLNYQKWTSSDASTGGITLFKLHSDWNGYYLGQAGWLTPYDGAVPVTICISGCNGWVTLDPLIPV